jgi:hypothetical protein
MSVHVSILNLHQRLFACINVLIICRYILSLPCVHENKRCVKWTHCFSASLWGLGCVCIWLVHLCKGSIVLCIQLMSYVLSQSMTKRFFNISEAKGNDDITTTYLQTRDKRSLYGNTVWLRQSSDNKERFHYQSIEGGFSSSCALTHPYFLD